MRRDVGYSTVASMRTGCEKKRRWGARKEKGAGGVAEEEGGEEDADEEDYDDDYDYDPFFVNPEDIQFAVDRLVSELMRQDSIPELKVFSAAPSLAEVFGMLFGEESQVTEQIAYFEELISGYEDRASIEDLREARRTLAAIIETLAPRRKGA